MSWKPITFCCRVCAHEWHEMTHKDEQDVITAAKANKQESVCDLCRHLIMAKRIAEHRRVSVAKTFRKVKFFEMAEAREESAG